MRITGKLIVAATMAAAAQVPAQTPPPPDPACWVRGSRDGLASRPSAFDSTTLDIGSRHVKVCYGAPKKNGRDIIGALVPFGEPWRLGANEATAILMPARGSIAGVPVQPGWYSLYVIPNRDEWRIVVNAAVERWGVPIGDDVRAMDVGSGTVRPEAADAMQETMRLQLVARGGNAADLVFHWDRTRVRIPVTLDPGR